MAQGEVRVRVTILTTGSQGDVRPYVALGRGLQRAGHTVRLASHADFEPLVRSHGLEFSAVLDEARAFHATAAGQRMIREGDNPFVFLRQFFRMREPVLGSLLERSAQACKGADLVVLSSTALFEGQAAAEWAGKPICRAFLQPATPTCHLASCLCPELPSWLPLSGLYRWLSHIATGSYFWLLYWSALNRARQEVLGLPAARFLHTPLQLLKHTPVLYGFSPWVQPPAPDWPAHCRVTGYWFLERPRNWQPPRRLTDFLKAGPPPVAIGFGSMSAGDAAWMTPLCEEALRRTGQRGLLLSGWGGLGGKVDSERLLSVEEVPHDWLFPRVRAVVHHGGAGTTGACLQAGVPSLVVPFMADQRFWGRRVEALGVGPRQLPRKKLSVERLERSLQQLTGEPAFQQRAAELGSRIRAEDGVRRAVEELEAIGDRLLQRSDWPPSRTPPHFLRRPRGSVSARESN
jgi:sterol 3beta-glucosyltransferase